MAMPSLCVGERVPAGPKPEGVVLKLERSHIFCLSMCWLLYSKVEELLYRFFPLCVTDA